MIKVSASTKTMGVTPMGLITIATDPENPVFGRWEEVGGDT